MAEFFSMGGYGYYVWMSMGMTFILMVGEILMLKQQRKSVLKQVARIVRMGRKSS